MKPFRATLAALAVPLAFVVLPSAAWSQQTAGMPLDVSELKSRLRETSAIGLFAKIDLRNQMDDLLNLFHAHHRSGKLAGIAALRLPYDLLLQKVLAKVEHGDPSLAGAISGSREALWAVLADRDSFNTMTSRLARAAT
jgi:hypothetical protein